MAVLEGRVGAILNCNSNLGDWCRRVIFRDLSIRAWTPLMNWSPWQHLVLGKGLAWWWGASGCWSAYLVKCTRTTWEDEESWSLGAWEFKMLSEHFCFISPCWAAVDIKMTWLLHPAPISLGSGPRILIWGSEIETREFEKVKLGCWLHALDGKRLMNCEELCKKSKWSPIWLRLWFFLEYLLFRNTKYFWIYCHSSAVWPRLT